MQVHGVLFDVDDTLVDHAGAQDVAIRAHLAALGLPSDDGAAAAWRAAEERHFARHLTGELSFQEQRRERVRETLGDDGYGDAEADEWFEGFARRFERAWRCFDDVAAVLDALAGAGVAVGIVTNVGSAHQRRKLDAVGLGGRFEVLVGLDTLGVGKPDAAVFHHACGLLGTQPGRTAFVGDRLDHDAVGARDAGLRAVWLDRVGADVAVPDRVCRVRSLHQLTEVLA